MSESPRTGHVLRIEPQGWACVVPEGETLWWAAKHAGIRLPRSCLNGTCRACMCQLQSGEINYTIEWPGLSADEKAAGFTLPCVARALTDLVLLVPDAVKSDST